jgi:molybdopterin molybdotransferase
MVLVSGGVSMGEFDLVGEALRDAGCRSVFERVAIQPGKPLFFGRIDRGPCGTLVFGLPGNPVSTVVDFLVFARPALRRIAGACDGSDPVLPARLEAAVTRRPGRRAYLPARLSGMGDELSIRLLPSMGSADIVALSRGNALAIIPEDVGRLEAGSMVSALPMDRR